MSIQVNNVKEYFDRLGERFVAAATKGMNAVFQFELGGEGGGTYHVVVSEGTFQVVEGSHASPTSTLKMDASKYIDMVNGKVNGTMAFMKGWLKVSGNVMMAQKMQSVFPQSKA